MQRHIRTFSTMTAGLLALADWLESMQVPVVAMESTGVYWRPVFHLIEEGRSIILVNAQQMKAVPGRKTDVKEAEWLADLPNSAPESPCASAMGMKGAFLCGGKGTGAMQVKNVCS
jgi:transposase